jgi:DNA-binding NarL/FixJ family response regulator
VAFRLLLAAGHDEYRQSLRELIETARGLLPVPLEVDEAASVEEARERLRATATDAMLADWSLAGADTLAAVRGLLVEHPDLRVLVLIPDVRRQYREAAWSVGACACVPRERIDPEWLQAMLCVMNRAKEREARICGRVGR